MTAPGSGFDDFGGGTGPDDFGGSDYYGDGQGEDPAFRPVVDQHRTLPPPPEIHPTAERSDIYGQQARTVPGRSEQSPLLTQASSHPGASQLRVFMRVRGQVVSLGMIEIGSTEEDLIRAFPKAMPSEAEGYRTFIFRPLTPRGTEMGHEFEVPISSQHMAIQQQRAQAAAAAGQAAGATGGGGGGHGPSAGESLLAATQRLVEMQMQGLALERDLLRKQQEEFAARSAATSEQVTMGVGNAYERIIAMDAERQAQATSAILTQSRQAADNTAGFLSSMLTAQDARARQDAADAATRAQRERDDADRRMMDQRERWRQEQEEGRQRREEERRAADAREARIQQEADRRLALVQAEAAERRRQDAEVAAAKSAREEREAREREADRQRKHDLEVENLRRRAEADAAHQERMARLEELRLEGVLKAQTAAHGSGGGLETMLEKAAGLLGLIGLDPKDALQRVIGGGGEEQPSVALELAKVVLPAAGGVLQAYFATKGGPQPRPMPMQQPRQIQQQPQAYQPGYDEGDEDDEDEDDEDDDDGGEGEAPQPRQQQAPRAAAPAQAPQPAAPSVQVGAPPPAAVRVGAAPPAPVVVGQGPAQLAPPAEAAAVQIGPDDKLSAEDMRIAKGALRALVPQIRQADDENAAAVVFLAIQQEERIWYYIQQVSLRVAVLEASGDDVAFLQRVVRCLQATPLVPAELNYGT